jgi:hypothetical protein
MNFPEISDYCSDFTGGNIDSYVKCTDTLQSCGGEVHCENLAKDYLTAIAENKFTGTFGEFRKKYSEALADGGSGEPKTWTRRKLIIYALSATAILLLGIFLIRLANRK